MRLKPESSPAAARWAQGLTRCLIACVLLLSILLKLNDASPQRWAGFAIAFDAALLIAVACGAIDRLADRMAALGLVLLAGVGIVLGLRQIRCGCFGAMDVPPFAGAAFALASAAFVVVGHAHDLRWKWGTVAASFAVMGTTVWLALGSHVIDATGYVAVDLPARQTSGSSLADLLELANGAQWDQARAVLFVSSSCGTCQVLLDEIERRWGAPGARWIALVDLEQPASGAERRNAPFLGAASREHLRLRIDTPAAAALRADGGVERAYAGAAYDIEALCRFLKEALGPSVVATRSERGVP